MHTIILILGTNIMVGNDSHKCILIEVVVVGCDPTAVASAEAVYRRSAQASKIPWPLSFFVGVVGLIEATNHWQLKQLSG